MGTQPDPGNGLSRRELMKRGMRAGVYATPVVLTAVAAIPAAAQVSRPTPTPMPTATPPPMPTATPVPAAPTLLLNGMPSLSVPLGSSFTVTGTGYPPNTTVYLVLLNTGTNTFSFITATSDATGAINATFNTTTTPVTATNGTGSYAVISTLTMPTAPPFTGQRAQASLTLTTPTVCTQAVPFTQDFVITAGAPNFTYDVFYLPNNVTPGACGANFTRDGTITTDAAGVGGTTFPVSLNPSAVTSVQVVALIPAFETPPAGGGCAPSNPLNPAATFTSNLVTTLACTNNGMRLPTPQLLSLIVQEQTAVAVGGAAPFKDLVDVGIFNGTPNTTYVITVQPNGTGTPMTVGSLTTNALGNATSILTLMTTGTAATSFTVNATLAGATAFTQTDTVANGRLINVPFVVLVAKPNVQDYHPQAYAIQ